MEAGNAVGQTDPREVSCVILHKTANPRAALWRAGLKYSLQGKHPSARLVRTRFYTPAISARPVPSTVSAGPLAGNRALSPGRRARLP